MGADEYYAMDKVARKVCEEELDKCKKGNEHHIEIKNMKGEIETMKTDATNTTKTLFEKLDNINNKFLAMAVTAVLELVSFLGAVVLLFLQSHKGP